MIQQNKDWNYLSQLFQVMKDVSPSMIQQNKDWNCRSISTWRRGLSLPEHDPTEQGLKHTDEFRAVVLDSSPSMIQQNKDWNWLGYSALVGRRVLPEHDPTEQGLKHIDRWYAPNCISPPRAWSNRTRIETH